MKFNKKTKVNKRNSRNVVKICSRLFLILKILDTKKNAIQTAIEMCKNLCIIG